MPGQNNLLLPSGWQGEAAMLADGEGVGDALSVGASADGSGVGVASALGPGVSDGVDEAGALVPEGAPLDAAVLADAELETLALVLGVEPVPLEGVFDPQAAASSTTNRREAAGARLIPSSVPGPGPPRRQLPERARD
jgi:hypothetical protein